MPYTNEQAKDALTKQMISDMTAKYRLETHKRCIREAVTYNLPYRVLWDYWNASHDYMEIPINPWYPYPKIPKSVQLPYEQRRRLNDNEKHTQEAEAYEKYRPWRLDTTDGMENWKRYFTCFIAPYADDIDTWSEFDLYGTSGHDPDEVERKRSFYRKLTQDYIEHPERYEGQRMKQINDYDLYDFADSFRGYMWNGCEADNVQPLPVMLKELEVAKEYQRREAVHRQEAEGEIKKYLDMIPDVSGEYLNEVNIIIEKLKGKGTVSN